MVTRVAIEKNSFPSKNISSNERHAFTAQLLYTVDFSVTVHYRFFV